MARLRGVSRSPSNPSSRQRMRCAYGLGKEALTSILGVNGKSAVSSDSFAVFFPSAQGVRDATTVQELKHL